MDDLLFRLLNPSYIGWNNVLAVRSLALISFVDSTHLQEFRNAMMIPVAMLSIALAHDYQYMLSPFRSFFALNTSHYFLE